MRKTVTITMPDETAPRAFHLEAGKAERFAESIAAAGGQAIVSDLKLDTGTVALFARLGLELPK